jgi:hypothetical protein
MQHEVRTCLFDILQAAKDIQEFARGLTYAQYLADAKTQAAVERKFEVVGEALTRIKRLDKMSGGSLKAAGFGDGSVTSREEGCVIRHRSSGATLCWMGRDIQSVASAGTLRATPMS